MDAFSTLSFSSLFSIGSSEYDVTSTLPDAPTVAKSQSSSLEDLPPLVDEEDTTSGGSNYCVIA
ncbi:hypothetical protein E1B28_010495 [Marasmius oreades]|uniref:Uncharacterized protein n=1 Tax=Marasmius oreades TaxID=181124 RepID=A0A9P7RX68_9AGAR|nr:uncharacterized protein E1B28_010495 [Marasmius oreades]KAG7091464.1 hypothetical protein E1B28_010495 [Marasmius oreades]